MLRWIRVEDKLRRLILPIPRNECRHTPRRKIQAINLRIRDCRRCCRDTPREDIHQPPRGIRHTWTVAPPPIILGLQHRHGNVQPTLWPPLGDDCPADGCLQVDAEIPLASVTNMSFASAMRKRCILDMGRK